MTILIAGFFALAGFFGMWESYTGMIKLGYWDLFCVFVISGLFFIANAAGRIASALEEKNRKQWKPGTWKGSDDTDLPEV